MSASSKCCIVLVVVGPKNLSALLSSNMSTFESFLVFQQDHVKWPRSFVYYIQFSCTYCTLQVGCPLKHSSSCGLPDNHHWDFTGFKDINQPQGESCLFFSDNLLAG